MRQMLLSILIITSTAIQSQDFYALDVIQKIEITFAENNWDQLLDNAKATTEDYIQAQSVAINGITFDSVGVKYKGNSTYNANQTKNPFHIELDTYKDQDYKGYTDIKLSNVSKDPSFVREVLSYQILRQYMDAPESNYANVYVNGTLIGLYSNSESVSKQFVKDRFGSKDNTFVKCNPPAGAGPQSSDFPNLVYQGADSSAYYDAYELKSESGWSDLIDLCDVLGNSPAEIEEFLDVDRAIWMLAFNNALVNLDSYIGGFAQNYYMYQADHGQFLPVVWDLNESFGRFAMTGSGNLNNTDAKIRMSPFLHETDSEFPLISTILANPRYRRMYVAHLKTFLQENFENGSYVETAEVLRDLIDADVQADDNKFFSYNNYLASLNSDVSGGGGGPGGGGSTPGISVLMDGRSEYVLGLTDFQSQPPTISEINSGSNIVGESATVTALIQDGDFAYIGYRDSRYDAFVKVEMFDDGAHGDGAAGDQIFGAEIPLTKTMTQYYIYAESAQAGLFSPRRAEHEFHTLLASTTSGVAGDLVINEIMASNSSTASDQDEEFDDWIELYNNTSATIDLTGHTLSDDVEELDQWVFPEGTTIEGGEYLIVWADKDDEQDGLHASFKLSADGESVVLVDPAGVILDELTFGQQMSDISYGRFPNGTGDFRIMVPTFAAENSDVSNTTQFEPKDNNLVVYPSPVSGNWITVSSMISDKQLGRVYNSQGVLIRSFVIKGQSQVEVSGLPPGVYLVKVGQNCSNFLITRK